MRRAACGEEQTSQPDRSRQLTSTQEHKRNALPQETKAAREPFKRRTFVERGGWAGGVRRTLKRNACGALAFWRAPSAIRSMRRLKNERANSNAQEHSRPHTTTQGPRSPEKQKQRVNYSRGEPERNAEDGRVGSEAFSGSMRDAAEAGAPHLPSAACAEQERTRHPDRSRQPTSNHEHKRNAQPSPNKAAREPLKRRTLVERGGWAGGVRSSIANLKSRA